MLNPVGLLSLQVACELLTPRNASDSLVNFSDERLSKSATELPSGYTVFPDIGVAYKYYANTLTWNAARKYCEKYGGSLAVIDSLTKLEYIRSTNVGSAAVFVGIHRYFDTAEWIDVRNGPLAKPLPWRSVTWENVTTALCMGVIPTVADDAGLFAAMCDNPRSFICQVSIFKD